VEEIFVPALGMAMPEAVLLAWLNSRPDFGDPISAYGRCDDDD
jgi:hypothetical protein